MPTFVPDMIRPGAGAAGAFLAVVAWVCVFVVWAVWYSGGADRKRRAAFAAVGLGSVLAVSAGLAEFGVVRRMAAEVPIAALVGFQAFRLPLELVLHQFYEEGVIPVQMTYSGANFDILTGVLALLCAAGLWRGKLPRSAVCFFNCVGLGLLVAVVRIAVLSAPTPMRAYMNDPPVQLIFHAPYTWILSICVAGALLGHLVVFRWLARAR